MFNPFNINNIDLYYHVSRKGNVKLYNIVESHENLIENVPVYISRYRFIMDGITEDYSYNDWRNGIWRYVMHGSPRRTWEKVSKIGSKKRKK